MNKRIYPSQKSKIIEAAEKLILEKGPGSLRTDAIIEASGLSKGGFFYHFKTMDDLLYELGKKNWLDFLEVVQIEAQKDPEPVGRFCRAYIKVSLHGPTSKKKKDQVLNNVFLEVALANRSIMDKIKKDSAGMNQFFDSMTKDDGLPPERVRLIQMAADGVWFNETVGFVKFKKKEKQELYSYLLKLTI